MKKFCGSKEKEFEKQIPSIEIPPELRNKSNNLKKNKEDNNGIKRFDEKCN